MCLKRTSSDICHTQHDPLQSSGSVNIFSHMTQIQEDLLGACNGLIKNQVDLIEEYSKKGIVTREQTMPFVETINEYIEGYLAYLSLEYDLVLSRMQLHHRMLTMMNDLSPRLTQIAIQSLGSFKTLLSQ